MNQSLLTSDPVDSSKINQRLTYSVMFRTIGIEILPIALLMAVSTINSAGSAMMVSNLSPKEDYSGASAIIFATQSAVTVIPSGFFYRINSILSLYKDIGPQIIVTNCIALAILLGIPLATFTYFIGKIFAAIGTRKEVCNIVDEYNNYFSPALFLYLIASSFYQVSVNLDETRESAYAASLINLVFTFGFGFLFTQVFAIPGLSAVATIGLSFLLGNAMRNLFYFCVFLHLSLFESSNNISSWEIHKKCFWDIVVNGFKAAIQLGSELGALNLLPFISEYFLKNKTVNLSILNTMLQYFMLSLTVSLILGQTAQRILRKKCSEEKYDEIRPFGNMLLMIGVVFNLLGLLLALTIPNTLASLFMNPHDNNNTGLSGDFRMMLAIQFLVGTLETCRNVIPFAWRPFGFINIPMTMSLISQTIGLSCSILLAKYSSLGIAGVLLGFYIGTIVGSLYLLPAWFHFSQPERAEKLLKNQEAREQSDKIFKFDFFGSRYHQDSLPYQRISNA